MLSNKPLLNLSAYRIIIIADLQKGWGPADLYWVWLQVGVVLGLWWQQLGQLYFLLHVCGSTEATLHGASFLLARQFSLMAIAEAQEEE